MSKQGLRENPSYFFVSTTSTTSTVTVTTATSCWTTAAGAAACGRKKRRRSILNDSIDSGKTEMAPENDIDPSIVDVEEQDSQREGRFFLYWLTTTSISTSTASSITTTR